MALNFPSNPSVNDKSIQNGRTYVWTGYAWQLDSSIASHTHISTDIIDFNSAVSGTLPFYFTSLSGVNNSGVIVNGDIILKDPSGSSQIFLINYSEDPLIAPRIIGQRFRGSDITPQIAVSGDALFVIRVDSLSNSGISEPCARIGCFSDGVVDANANYTPTTIKLQTSSGKKQIDNVLDFDSKGFLINYGSISSYPRIILPTGITTESVVGIESKVIRNTYPLDHGPLTSLYGCNIIHGHGASGLLDDSTTTSSYGLSITPTIGNGLISNIFDLYLASPIPGSGAFANTHYGIFQASSAPNYLSGSLSVDNGLSSPTKIHSLGSVSGNVYINYGINYQIQQLTLNGSLTNIMLGSSWPSGMSVDVVLEMNVNSTTSILWDIVDDWYNQPPIFASGKYLVLLRSMGSSVIQGHYIGKKTN
jgi:hypothetical protein